jgi:hypothetical protein
MPQWGRRGGVAHRSAGPAARGGADGPVDVGAPEAAQRRGEGHGVGDHPGSWPIWTETTVAEARLVLVNAPAPAPPGEGRVGRLVAAVADLDTILDRARAGHHPDPHPPVRCHPGIGDPAGVAARPERPPDRQGPARQTGTPESSRPHGRESPGSGNGLGRAGNGAYRTPVGTARPDAHALFRGEVARPIRQSTATVSHWSLS